MRKIVLFALYFGPLPEHIGLWARSCGGNTDIDWVLITDQEIGFALPPNMKYLRSDMASIRRQFSDIIGFAANLTRPYKLCDFRPAYGLIFADLAREYDFWGYCDLDVIFGDIRAFITEEILAQYDKIQALGHLSLYRNTERVNTLFRESCAGVPDYREVFSESRHYCFDERNGIYEICRQREIPRQDVRAMAAIRPYQGRFRDGISGWDQVVFYWEGGKAFMARLSGDGIDIREIMYVHFRKRRIEVSPGAADAPAFFLVPNMFLSKEPGVLSREDIAERGRGIPLYGITSRISRLRKRGLRGYWERRAVSRIWRKGGNRE